MSSTASLLSASILSCNGTTLSRRLLPVLSFIHIIIVVQAEPSSDNHWNSAPPTHLNHCHLGGKRDKRNELNARKPSGRTILYYTVIDNILWRNTANRKCGTPRRWVSTIVWVVIQFVNVLLTRWNRPTMLLNCLARNSGSWTVVTMKMRTGVPGMVPIRSGHSLFSSTYIQ